MSYVINYPTHCYTNCLHFILKNSIIFILPSSCDIAPIFIACLMLDISTLVASAWPILCLATHRLSLASLDASKILIITTMFSACVVKHCHALSFCKRFSTTSHTLPISTWNFTFVGMCHDGYDRCKSHCVCWNERRCIVGGFHRPLSKMPCFLFNMFLLACLSICFNNSNTSLLCMHALNPSFGLDLLVLTSFKKSWRRSFNVSSCKTLSR